jgi:hypothetical protein
MQMEHHNLEPENLPTTTMISREQVNTEIQSAIDFAMTTVRATMISREQANIEITSAVEAVIGLAETQTRLLFDRQQTQFTGELNRERENTLLDRQEENRRTLIAVNDARIRERRDCETRWRILAASQLAIQQPAGNLMTPLYNLNNYTIDVLNRSINAKLNLSPPDDTLHLLSKYYVSLLTL